MKPLMTEARDNDSLRALGLASVQIVHDLKNQINGLKLYATFLRKRLEKGGRPDDELETVNKLITGLDRTAADLSMISEFGQPVSLKKQPGIDLQKILSTVVTTLNEGPRVSGSLLGPVTLDSDNEPLTGDFDSSSLTEALKSISKAALKLMANKPLEQSLNMVLRLEMSDGSKHGVIEWRGFASLDHDPFHSFVGSDEIRMSLAARIIEAHGGTAQNLKGNLRVRLPLTS
jgi:nitrogen fixation/metabolism regulation signal transduction histidine kinase